MSEVEYGNREISSSRAFKPKHEIFVRIILNGRKSKGKYQRGKILVLSY